jgi:hypothetical protein
LMLYAGLSLNTLPAKNHESDGQSACSLINFSQFSRGHPPE